MKRRQFLLGAAALGLAGAGTVLASKWPEQGLKNACLANLPTDPEVAELMAAVWQGLDPTRVWDCHAHLIGVGDGGSGIRINPAMDSLLNPVQYVQKIFYMNAGCVHEAPGQVDRSFVARLANLAAGMAPGFKLLLLAFDAFHDQAGQISWPQSVFYTPDAWARDMARAYPAHFEWVASIHPYRADALERLEQAAKDGARAVKWLPAAQGIDPASPRCERFYDALARLKLPLISHAGKEQAVHSPEFQHCGNPLLLRRPLERGVRVVVAHCASHGEDVDLDQGAHGPSRSSLELFGRLMDDPRFQGRLFGDISALTQVNRAGALRRVLARTEWHGRLLNGSDYPLPGVMPLFSASLVADMGLLPARLVAPLKRIRSHNPLLFDFALKRSLRLNGRALPATVFETRPFFDPIITDDRPHG